MGILNKLFGGKKSVASILIGTQKNILNDFGITSPTDAQRLKASVYICIAGIGILNDVGRGQVRHLIDEVVFETKELTKHLSLQVEDLANSEEELEEILANFPKEFQINRSTMVNGLAAFEALYFAKVETLVERIQRGSQGPMKTPGIAALVVTEGIFGKDNEEAQEKFVAITMQMLNFTSELIEAI